MEKTGSGIELGLKTYDNYVEGKYEDLARDATYTAVSSYILGKLNKGVDNLKDAGKITKTDKGILNIMTDTWNAMADWMYGTSTKKDD